MNNLKPDRELMTQEVLEGLSKPVKELPCKYLYDERGSVLFDQITRVGDYYPTRTEREIIHDNIGEITESMGEKALLIYYGSSTGEKARVILDNLPSPAAYVPIDISGDHLMKSAAAISEDYPDLEIIPVCADFTQPFEIPEPQIPPARPVVYYPGSTIGNFIPEDAVQFLGKIGEVIGEEGGLYLGVDLIKDSETLHAAYNDSEGVTARFNLNLLAHLNRELKTDFEVSQFRHEAIFNSDESRVEMHLVSETDQKIHIGDSEIEIKEGESIWTESSYKYTLDRFSAMAGEAGLEVRDVWTDRKKWFSFQHLSLANG